MRLTPLLLVAVLAALGVGCASRPSEPPAEDHAQTEAIRNSVERIRTLVHSGRPTPARLREIESICHELGMRRRAPVVRVVLESLHTHDDEVNSIYIHLLDDLDATDWVPVEYRARAMTIMAAVELAGVGANQVEQGDGYIRNILSFCASGQNNLARVWLDILCEPRIDAWQRDRRVNIAARVHGLAMLGLIRMGRPGDLDEILRRLEDGKVTASPAVLSQGIIHLSGEYMRGGLLRWLDGDARARRAGCMACGLLLLRRTGLNAAPAEEIERRTAWAKTLPRRATWRAVAYAALEELVAEAAKAGTKNAGVHARLARARRCLQAPEAKDPLKHMRELPAQAQVRALEHLVGIDVLLRGGAGAGSRESE